MSTQIDDSKLALKLMSHVDFDLFQRLKNLLDELSSYDDGLINIISRNVGVASCTNINSFGNTLFQKRQAVEMHYQDATFKIEGFETDEVALAMSKELPSDKEFDCHVFINFGSDAPSFDFHEDDKDVVILLLKGHKVVEFEGGKIVPLTSGRCVSISRGTRHRVRTPEPSIALSLGYIL